MKIVLIEPIALSKKMIDEYRNVLSLAGHEFVSFDSKVTDNADFIERTKDVEILIISTCSINREKIKLMPKLKMISIAFTGFDHVDTEYCKEYGISVSNAAGYSTISVAEQSILMILSLLRNSHKMEDLCRSGKDRQSFLGTELSALTVGIIGYGLIGKYVADILAFMGCKIVLAQRDSIPEHQTYEIMPLEELLKISDVVSLHVPMNKGNMHLISSFELQIMKKNAILINTARGTVVDNKALSEALKNKQISGAAIDIFETEPPLPETHPLLDAPNVLLMPHTAYATTEAIEKRSVLVLKNVVNWLDGKGGNVIA